MRKNKNIFVSRRTRNGKTYKYYVVSWYDAEGKQHTTSFPYGDEGRKDAQAFRDEIEETRQNGIAIKKTPTLGEWVTSYLKTVKYPVLREKSYGRYVDSAKKLEGLWGRFLDEITPLDIHRIYERMLQEGLSTSSVHTLHVLLTGAFSYAVANDLLIKNPMVSVRAPAVTKKDTHIFTYREIRKIFGTYKKMREGKVILGKKFRSPHNYRILFWMLLTTGMRIAELLALEWKDVNFKKRIIHVHQAGTSRSSVTVEKPKTKAGDRYIPIISDALLKGLYIMYERTLYKDGFIFAAYGSHGKKMLMQQNLLKVWRKILKEAGVEQPLGQAFHPLRHTFASYVIRTKSDIIPLSSLSRILGHAKVAITLNIYQHHLPDDNERILQGFNKKV